MSIIIGADLVPTQSNYDLFEKKDLATLFGKDLLSTISEVDFRIFNLETPLTDTKTPIEKNGPALITPTRAFPGIKALGVDLFAIANNHILDQGEQGFYKTCEILRENGIPYVGGGENLSEANRAFCVECGGKKIGVYACAEHEFSIATANTCGANPFDSLESPDHVAALKAQCDYVIVLYHGGKEHYRYPSPNLQKVCRKLVDKGADLVVCQHSHCIGCEEKYKDATIVYGQGNFIFDLNNSECWQTGLLVKLEDDFSISYLPLQKQGSCVRLACDEAAKDILDSFKRRSEEIAMPDFIETEYAKYANQMKQQYLFAFCGVRKNLLFRIINKLTGNRYSIWVLKKKYNKETCLRLKNYLECEAHTELILHGMENEILSQKNV